MRKSLLFLFLNCFLSFSYGQIVSPDYSISAGEYFGEQSLLSKIPRKTTAIVSSDWSRIIIASESQIKKILIEDSQIALKFLSHMARL